MNGIIRISLQAIATISLSAMTLGCAASASKPPVGEDDARISAEAEAAHPARAEHPAHVLSTDTEVLRVRCDRHDEPSCLLYNSILACRQGSASDCDFAGAAYFRGVGVSDRDRGATAYWSRACNIAPERCTGYGLQLLASPGNEKAAQQLFDKACNEVLALCVPVGVLFLGGTAGVSEDRMKARTYFRAGCDSGIKAACDLLAR